jgi:hypothetical protein
MVGPCHRGFIIGYCYRALPGHLDGLMELDRVLSDLVDGMHGRVEGLLKNTGNYLPNYLLEGDDAMSAFGYETCLTSECNELRTSMTYCLGSSSEHTESRSDLSESVLQQLFRARPDDSIESRLDLP